MVDTPQTVPQSYGTSAVIAGALSYASDTSKVGAKEMRKLVKASQMLEDPHMEAYLAQTTETFCELVFRVCQLIKDIGADNALTGIHLISTTRNLLVAGMVMTDEERARCPLHKLFATQEERLMAYQRLRLMDSLVGEESAGDPWYASQHEWMPPLASRPPSSDEDCMDDEKVWLEEVSRKRWVSDQASKVPVPNPKRRPPWGDGSVTA
jgi:hypothetical protein